MINDCKCKTRFPNPSTLISTVLGVEVNCAFKLRPTSKCDGVIGSVISSLYKYVIGRVFITDSTSIKTVLSSSNVNLAFPIVFFNDNLIDLTSRS